MRKFLLAAAGLVAAMGMATPASAADLPAAPYKVPVMIPALYDWSGFYTGLNGGGGGAHKCWDINNVLGAPVPVTREGCHDATGAIAGGQVGFRWQSDSWVFGVEAQGDWADLKGSNASAFAGFGPPFAAAMTNRTRVDAFGLFTGQVGYAWNNVLWYVKGGGALAADRYTGVVTATGVTIDGANQIRWGGTVGTGVEFSFAPGWSVAFEYDHLFLGSQNVNFNFFPNLNAAALINASRMDNIRQDADIGTVRVNYRWGGPVIAKY
jgi:outer membrane immunogenic protein